MPREDEETAARDGDASARSSKTIDLTWDDEPEARDVPTDEIQTEAVPQTDNAPSLAEQEDAVNQGTEPVRDNPLPVTKAAVQEVTDRQPLEQRNDLPGRGDALNIQSEADIQPATRAARTEAEAQLTDSVGRDLSSPAIGQKQERGQTRASAGGR